MQKNPIYQTVDPTEYQGQDDRWINLFAAGKRDLGIK